MNKPLEWRQAADPLTEPGKPTFAAVRQDLARVPLARRITTVVFIVVAILLARWSWTLPLALDAERAFYDVRALEAALASPASQDKRILLIPFTPETQWATGERSPLDRTTLAKALSNLDAMGARSIGIDILIDQPQPDDRLLIGVLRRMKTPVYMGYATNASNPEDIQPLQQAFMEEFHRAVANPLVRKASVRIEEDSDNVMRNWPVQHRDHQTFLPVAMSGQRRAASYNGSILYRQPANREYAVFNSLPIDLFTTPEGASLLAGEVKGRHVLIGGDLPDFDQFETPETRLADDSEFGRRFRATIPGLEVHATMLAQILDGRLPGRISGGALWIIAICAVLAGAFTSMIDVRPWVLVMLIVGQLGFFGAAPFFFERIGIDTQTVPAFGWLAGWMLAYMATEMTVKAMGSEEKRFAQSALGKYLPRDIAAQILKDPSKLSLRGERLPIYTLFTDIEGFTGLSHQIPAEKTAAILNAYLDGMSDIVLDYGGTIDKFVGDAVVAFWGAPIARPEDGEHAIAAALAMLEFTRNFGKDDPDRAMLGRTRIGLHHGEAIVGNFGGEGRISYTALGDAMNTAARLEGANKYLKTRALISEYVRTHVSGDILRPMGRIVLSGRPTPITVWEPAPEMDAAIRAELTRLWEQFDGGDREALHAIEAIAAKYDKDVALAAFACRLREAGPGGHFVLGEK